MSDLARALLDELAGDPVALERLRELIGPPPSDPSPELMTVNEVAKALGRHPTTVRRRITDGAIPAIREGERVVVRADDLRAYVERLQRIAGKSPARPRRQGAPDLGLGFLHER
jgi:excisionase family DNA binding protein